GRCCGGFCGVCALTMVSASAAASVVAKMVCFMAQTIAPNSSLDLRPSTFAEAKDGARAPNPLFLTATTYPKIVAIEMARAFFSRSPQCAPQFHEVALDTEVPRPDRRNSVACESERGRRRCAPRPDHR